MLHKSFFISLICAVALTLSSCGGGGKSKVEDFIWFKAEIPEGFVADTLPGNPRYTDVFFWNEENGMKREIKPGWFTLAGYRAKTMDDYLQSLSKTYYTIGDEVTIGKYTWKTVSYSTYQGSDRYRCSYYVETNRPGTVFQLEGLQMKLDDPAWQVFLKNFSLPDDIEAAQKQAYNTKFGEYEGAKK